LKNAGKIIHFTKNGLYVIEAKTKVLPGTQLYDASGRPLALAVDLIGPINNPYIVAKPLAEKPEKFVGGIVYFRLKRRKPRGG
jgi:rRNA processing protein Gar1